MMVRDLPPFLNAHSVPPYLYTFGGLGDGECVGLDRKDDRWIVYFSERGGMNSVREHIDEQAAVADFLKRLNVQLEAFEGRTLPG